MSPSLAVVCFLWHDPKSKWRDVFWYGPEHVVVLRNMAARHLTIPHRFLCVTDRPELLPADIETVPLDTSLITPSERYAKLMIWRPDAAELFGAERILAFDLDVVITGNIDHLVEHDHPVALWANPRFPQQPIRRSRYNTSLVYLRAGARPDVWEQFDIHTSPDAVRATGVCGTDQGWVSMVLGDTAHGFGCEAGIYSFRIHVQRLGRLPQDARLVSFHGNISPHLRTIQEAHPWVRKHYR
jgi:hypothetical protein